MKKLVNFFSHLKDMIAFNQLPKEDRVLTFYSEGINYWSYLGGLVQNILDSSDITICYLTASREDPALKISHPKLKVFVIGEGYIRDWLFANIETKVMVMTMPDLHQYQVKRSVHNVHYIYVQHSLVSFHMVYRPGAFDHFDTIFCAGPHHIEEMRAIETTYNLSAKTLFKHGYARLDAIKLNTGTSKESASPDGPERYLLAPSWGPHSTIETGLGKDIVDMLIAHGKHVTLRPHPQTLKFARDKVDAIIDAHKHHPLFTFETNVEGHSSLQESDIMICDWSGAALDYAFGFEKPVLFIDVPRKVNNPEYEKIPIEPIEVSIRETIGAIIHPHHIESLLDVEYPELPPGFAQKYVYNIGKSDQIGAAEIVRLVNQ